MLAKLCETPFNSQDHIFEPKLDGIRCIAYKQKGVQRAVLLNRHGVDITARFPEVADSIEYDGSCVLDGELVCLDDEGVPDFQAIQTRANRVKDISEAAQANPAEYIVFDVMESRGTPLLQKTLRARKAILAKRLTDNDHVSKIWYSVGDGITMLDELTERGFEGVMAKELSSLYWPGRRIAAWQKLKARKEDTFVVVGITAGTGRRAGTFGALIVAVPHGDDFVHMGEVGTGFDDEEVADLYELLTVLKAENGHTPTVQGAQEVRQVVKWWTEPRLKIKVSYLELSNGGKLRHPSYEGLVE